MRYCWIALVALRLSACAAEKYELIRPGKYSGMADASGGVALTTNLFVAASDEDNILRVYDANQEGAPIKELKCNAFLELTGKSAEADLEAATRIGNRIFWIGSHGRNQKGKERSNRCRLFATDFKVEGSEISLRPVGRPCKTLLDALIADPQFERFHFAEAASRAPKGPGALNIEGLAATADGHLLIGFRNPIPHGKALLIPLLNPNEVIEEKMPRFGAAIQLDLDGFGIRDIEWIGKEYLIIAGSYKGGEKSKFYHWKGPGAEPEKVKIKHTGKYNPEAIIVYPESGRIQILSDDGTRRVDGLIEKELPEASHRTFRSFWLEAE